MVPEEGSGSPMQTCANHANYGAILHEIVRSCDRRSPDRGYEARGLRRWLERLEQGQWRWAQLHRTGNDEHYGRWIAALSLGIISSMYERSLIVCLHVMPADRAGEGRQQGARSEDHGGSPACASQSLHQMNVPQRH
jgi:hypothetical protein